MKTDFSNRLLLVTLAVIIGASSQIQQQQPAKSSGPLAVLRTTIPQAYPGLTTPGKQQSALTTTTAQMFPDKSPDKKRYVLIGDSILFGDGGLGKGLEIFKSVEAEIEKSDPNAEFFKCAKGWRHLIKNGQYSFQHDTFLFHECVLTSNADVYVVFLGSNDAKWGKWNPFDFVNDYTELCKFMKDQQSKPKVYLAIPPPFYPQFGKDWVEPAVINEYLPELIPRVAKQCKLKKEQVIDLFTPMGGASLSKPELYCEPQSGIKCDGFHPAPGGYQVMAKTILDGLLK